MPDHEDFVRLADPFRRELLAHCYRMLGSLHDAEDLVQETFLRAWRSYETFEGRSSLRTWLYRIATNVCLTALETRTRRPMPSGLGAPGMDPERQVVASGAEVTWLEPIPDAMYVTEPADPAAIVASRENMRLALVAAMQHLPARQRAILILRDVLKWRAAEVAELLGTTSPAVNSVLQRARAQLEQVAPIADEVAEPSDTDQRLLLDRYAAAFENDDIASLMDLLTKDAVWEMPPFPEWFVGSDAIARLINTQCPAGPGDRRMIPTRANGQPAFAMYMNVDGTFRPHSLQVLTITKAGVTRVGSFMQPEIFPFFDLPETLPPHSGG